MADETQQPPPDPRQQQRGRGPGWNPPPQRQQPRQEQQREPQKVRRFEPPPELDALFNVTFQNEDRIEGLIETHDIRKLLDDFGVQERTDIQFPFQHIRRRNGEVWRMRIEPAGYHTLNGEPVQLHHWVYQQDSNERVEQAQG